MQDASLESRWFLKENSSIVVPDRGEQDEVCQVGSRNKIFKFLFLDSSKNRERSFQIFLNMSRNKHFYYQHTF